MTLNDFYREVLEHLTVVAEGQIADAADVQKIARKYAQVYENLLSIDLVAWAKTDDLPDYAVMPLVAMVAAASAKDFGMAPDTQEASVAEFTLRRALAKRYVSHPAQSEYF